MTEKFHTTNANMPKYLRMPAIKYVDIEVTALVRGFRDSFRHGDLRQGVFKD